MEKYKRKAESSWTEKDLDKALEAVRAGMSMQRAARTCGVPYTCINRRLKSSTYVKKRGGQTVFSPAQENELTCRIIKLSKCGFGPTPKDVRSAAYIFAEEIK